MDAPPLHDISSLLGWVVLAFAGAIAAVWALSVWLVRVNRADNKAALRSCQDNHSATVTQLQSLESYIRDKLGDRLDTNTATLVRAEDALERSTSALEKVAAAVPQADITPPAGQMIEQRPRTRPPSNHGFRILLIAAFLLPLLTGCMDDATRAAIATSAATEWEAAEAIRRGADPAGPVAVIQANASATAHAVGFTYPAPAPVTGAHP